MKNRLLGLKACMHSVCVDTDEYVLESGQLSFKC
jgi:hypothetical protein